MFGFSLVVSFPSYREPTPCIVSIHDSDVPTLILAALHIRGLGKKGTEEERLNLIRQTLGDGKLGKLVSAQLMVSCSKLQLAVGDEALGRFVFEGKALKNITFHPSSSTLVAAWCVDDMAKAAETLETVSEVRHQPAVVGYLVAVYNKLGRATDAERVLAESVQHWQTHAKVRAHAHLKASPGPV